ncbi:hypothetical protein Taro_038099 [Colocasia esculenta]|uniref:Uncharacterized protein n=1 Tax=Colocasia esculenta TaxID=4460 RepID=A0A843W2G8_COLES|nr:hypothetical protein [Colocasia esculenta]
MREGGSRGPEALCALGEERGGRRGAGGGNNGGRRESPEPVMVDARAGDDGFRAARRSPSFVARLGRERG